MPLVSPKPRAPATWPGGHPLGGVVTSPYSTVDIAEIKDGNNNITVNNIQVGVVHCYQPNSTHNQTANWVEYWVLFQQAPFHNAVDDGVVGITWVNGGGSSWAVYKAQHQANMPPGAQWYYYQVSYQYQDKSACTVTGLPGKYTELRYGSTVVGRMAHRHVANGFAEHWFLDPAFDTPTTGAPFDMVVQAGPKSVGDLKNMALPNAQYVHVTWTAYTPL